MREYSINIDDYAKVTDNEEYITGLLEEKAQVEEQYLRKKQITTG